MKTRTIINILLIAACTNAAYATDFVTFKRHSLSDIELTRTSDTITYDPLSPQLADDMGIVMGTSHHEPMMRAHKEYVYRKDSIGAWDYATSKANLDRFFEEGLERNKAYDNLITIGMRGDGDVAMGNGNDEDNMKTLKDVVDGQREIIERVYKKPASEVPQLWAIFTEVQRYYDAGFTVPDDVTLLFCDNNWDLL